MSDKNPIRRGLNDNYYLSMKTILNRRVFRTDLKVSRNDTFLISASKLFRKVGAATLNAKSPYDLSRDTGHPGA